MKNMKNSAKKISVTALFTALTVILSYIEVLIPFNVFIYGAKLGLANIGIILTMYLVDIKSAYMVNLIRILIIALWFGNIYTFLFSLAGGMLSLTVMAVLFRFRVFNLITVSMFGGICHNIGQIAVAFIIIDNSAVLYYMPLLLPVGFVTGLVIGIVSDITVKRIGRININL